MYFDKGWTIVVYHWSLIIKSSGTLFKPMTVFVFFKKDLKDELINLHIYIYAVIYLNSPVHCVVKRRNNSVTSDMASTASIWVFVLTLFDTLRKCFDIIYLSSLLFE